MKAFRNILHLSAGDFVAKALNFFTFVYLARVLGVTGYGVLEFAISVMTYFLLLGDAGLELWAMREAAQGKDVQHLVKQIVPLRFVLALISFGALLALLPLFPDYPGLTTVLTLFGLTLFTQALNLKWLFLGRENMGRVAAGLVLSQIIFTAALLGLVRDPSSLVWVPIFRVAGDLAMGLYFWRLFLTAYGRLWPAFTLRGSGQMMRRALTLGASHGLALMSFNLDSVLLGFFLGATAVGLYSAAYKPVTMILAMPVTYFIGLFPTLSRAHAHSAEEFRGLVVRSFRLTAIIGLPLGVGGMFLAAPVIKLLFGPAYAGSVPALQILSWSAVLVVLRGTYRQALNAANRSDLDLRCAIASVALNLCLNLLLIPRYGIVGAAVATLVSEGLWMMMTAHYFYRRVSRIRLFPQALQPLIAVIAMGSGFLLLQSFFWVIQLMVSVVIYFGILLLFSETEVRSWLRTYKARQLVPKRHSIS